MTGDVVPFTVAVEDVSAGNTKIPQSEFLNVGRLAVVDQGQSIIAGYTDDSTAVVKTPPPVIVFGDHTRALKFVDFPFAMGADGVKVLRSREGFEPRFIYHYLRTRTLPNAGYSRHFKFLKEVLVPKPPLPEQRRIAAILDHADGLRAKRRQVLAHLEALNQSIFHDMFGDPTDNPRHDAVMELHELIAPGRPITYGILKPGPDLPNGIPYIRVADIQNGAINLNTVRRTSAEIASSYRRSVLREGDLLISIRGHVGRFAHVPAELAGANITQDSARLSIGDVATSQYVRGAMTSVGLQRWMARHTKGVAVRGLNIGDLRQLPIPVPPLLLRQRFAERVERVDAQRAAVQHAVNADDELFASLQARAFDGRL